jgi:hypothetical protein
MAYDRDGTVIYTASTGFTTIGRVLTAAETAGLNSEDATNRVSPGNTALIMTFPELRDITAQVASSDWYSNGPSSYAVSSDTTNGIDGTWTTIPGFSLHNMNRLQMRTAIVSTPATGVRSIRWKPGEYGAGTWHIYGTMSTPDDLLLWDASLDQRVDPSLFDFGEAAQSSTHIKTFRVKNLNATQTAYSVSLSVEALTDATPSFAGEHTLSTDGTTFAPTVNIGDLAPGVISGTLTLQQALPANAALSLWWARINVNADHWA